MTVALNVDTNSRRKTGCKEDDDIKDTDSVPDYRQETVIELVRSRAGWLVFFCVGLLFAAFVVEEFEDLLEKNVQLSFFVPLIMGHGGNTGSQSVTTVIRALALQQVAYKDLFRVVAKEAASGCITGCLLGLFILAFAAIWSGISTKVGAVVAIALPIVSLWANGLGALLTLMAHRYGFDPAVTSVPFMTTIVDSTGLVIYFYLAKVMLGLNGTPAPAGRHNFF